MTPRLVFRSALAAFAALLVIATHASAATPPVYPYHGNGCVGLPNVAKFDAWFGRKADGVTDFIDRRDWVHAVDDMKWTVGCWKGHGYKLSIAIPMLVDSDKVTLAQGAAGANDFMFKEFARVLVAGGFADAYVRIGWEFNGGWYRWRADLDPTSWVAYYRRIVGIMRAAPGARFHFVWNPNLYVNMIVPSRVYPGDDVVDVIGQDTYDRVYPSTSDPVARWKAIWGGADSWGLQTVVNFAAAHNKPLAFPEVGAGEHGDGSGGGDNPYFFRQLAALAAAQGEAGAPLAFIGIWDCDCDYNSQMSNGERPREGAEFLRDFRGQGPEGAKATLPKRLAATTRTHRRRSRRRPSPAVAL